MKSVFHKEKVKGGVLKSDGFAKITPGFKSHLVNKPLSDREIEKLSKIKFGDQKGKF